MNHHFMLWVTAWALVMIALYRWGFFMDRCKECGGFSEHFPNCPKIKNKD